MSLELLILGLITEKNLYGYEIKKKIDVYVKDFADIKVGSVYYFLKKALGKGWIEVAGTQKNGSNPDRYIYQILPEGKKYFQKNLYQYFSKRKIHFSVDLAHMFCYTLKGEERKQFITKQNKLITRKISHIRLCINEEKKRKNNKLQFYKYIERHLQAELKWLKMLPV